MANDAVPGGRDYSMSDTESVGPVQEYATLREELQQAKRYVFERPILIVGLAVAGLNALGGEYVPLLTFLLAALLLFNFWFTVNRLFSAARIVAYIQLELEEGAYGQWAGWETCLRFYRKWLKQNAGGVSKIIESDMDQGAVPDALMYYPPIFQIHLGLVCLATIGAVVSTVLRPAGLSVAGMVATVSLLVVFCFYCSRYKPARMRVLIERNRAIWKHVFSWMQEQGAKS
jgi:hypothetical protein